MGDIRLSAFDWAIGLSLVSALGFMLSRFVKAQDRLTESMTDLAIAIQELKNWVSENHVTKDEFFRVIGEVREDVDRELKHHNELCPMRRKGD